MSGPAVIVFARMDSARLPGKVLADLSGRPLLGRVLDRVRRSQRAGGVIVATSDREVDDPLVRFCAKEMVDVFRGDCADVAGRAVACCDAREIERFVRISGDSPFIPPELIDQVIDVAGSVDADLVTNVFPRSYPPGASVEAISVSALLKAHPAMTPLERENLTTHFYGAPVGWRIENVSAGDDRYAGLRLTVDTAEELERARALAGQLGPRPEAAPLDDVARLCRALADAA